MRHLSKTWIVVLALACAAASGCHRPAVDAPGARSGAVARYTIEQFLDTTAYTGGSFSPDGSKILVSSDATGVYNAFAIPVEGGEPVQLTSSTDDAIFAYAYFPGDERFVYGSDRGGDEQTHLYVRERDGSVRDLTPGENVKAAFHGFSQDGHTLWVATNERDARYFDLYAYDANDYERTLVLQNDEGWEIGPVSSDGRWVALHRTHTTTDGDVWLHDRTTGETTNLTPHEGESDHVPEDFAPDGSLYYTTDEGAEFDYLVRYDPATGRRETVLQPDWDVTSATVSHDGTYLVVAVNADAQTDLRLYRRDGELEPMRLTSTPRGDVTSLAISRDEEQMLFYVSGSRSPRDLFVQALPEGEPRRLTRSLSAEIDPDHLVEGEVVRFDSYDGTTVPGLLYRPHGAGRDRRVPALVWVHGGPGGQSRLDYSPLVQYLVNHGYAVYAINNRGSSGYGKTFYKLDDRQHGEADLRDVVASRDMLAGTGFVDPERIGIIGGSYGGYMVLAALAFEPEAFEVGVDLFGVANWPRTLESIPPYWESFRKALYAELGDPATDAERLHRISPLFHAENITRPLMVLQGANDPRVLKVESDEMVAAARANGAIVEYLVFDDEGHGFDKKENRLRGYRAILEFLDRHLRG